MELTALERIEKMILAEIKKQNLQIGDSIVPQSIFLPLYAADEKLSQTDLKEAIASMRTKNYIQKKEQSDFLTATGFAAAQTSCR